MIALSLPADSLVWQALQDDTLYLSYLEKADIDPTAFSPGMIAAWLIAANEDLPCEALISDETPLPIQLRQKVASTFEAVFNTGLPPVDLVTAGLLALALRERYRIKGSWQGVWSEILIDRRPGAIEKNVLIWRTPLACLRSFHAHFAGLLDDYFSADSGDQCAAFFPIVTHAILTQPQSAELTLNELFHMTSHATIDEQLHVLRILARSQRTDLMRDLSHNLLQVKQNVKLFASALTELDAFSTPTPNDDFLHRPIRLSLVEDLNRMAELSLYAGDPQRANAFIEQANHVLEYKKHQETYQILKTTQSPSDVNRWQQLAEAVPQSMEVQYHYVQALISRQLNEEARSVIETLPESPEKQQLSRLIDPDQHIDDSPVHLEDIHASPIKQPRKSVFSEWIDSIPPFERSLDDVLMNQAEFKSGLNSGHITRKPDYTDLKSMVRMSEEYTRQGLYEEAIGLTLYLSMLEPDNAAHTRKLAQRYGLAQRWLQAFNTIQPLVKADNSPQMDDLLLLAQSALHTQQIETAIAVCQGILKEDPHNTQALILLGEGFLQQGDTVKAIQHMEKVVETIPESSATWLGLARIWQNNGQPERALEVLQKSVLALPNQAELLQQLGKIYLDRSSPADALPYLKQAHAIDPCDSKNSIYLAEAFASCGYYSEAWSLLKALPPAHANDPAMAWLFGRVLLGLGRPTEAKPHLILAASHLYDNRDIVTALAEVVIQEYDSADPAGTELERHEIHAILNKCLLVHPEDQNLLRSFADMKRHLHQHQEAFEIYIQLTGEETAESTHLSHRVQFGLGKSALALGNADLAMAALQSACKQQPENITYLHALAEAYLATNLSVKAGETAETALQLAPYDRWNLTWYSHFQNQRDEPQAAARAIQDALLMDPDQPDLKLMLIKSLIASGDQQSPRKILKELALLPDISRDSLHQAAYAATQIQQTELAIQLLEKAVEKEDVISSLLWLDLASAYTLQGQLRNALALLNVDLTVLKQHPAIALMKSDLLSTIGHRDLALSTLEIIKSEQEQLPASSESSDNPYCKSPLLYAADISRQGYFVRLSQLLQAAGLPEDSDAAIAMANELAPDRQKILFTRMKQALLSMAFEDVLSAESKIATPGCDADEQDAFCALVEAMLYLKQMEKAYATLARIDAIESDSPWLTSLRAREALHNGKVDQAEELLKSAALTYHNRSDDHLEGQLENIFNQLLTLNGLAEAALQMDDIVQAAALYAEAVAVLNNQPLINYRFAVTLITCAEQRRLSEKLAIVRHAPGADSLSGETRERVSNLLKNIQSLINEREWQALKARSIVAFEGQWPEELNPDFGLHDPLAAAALIVGSPDAQLVRQALDAYSNDPHVLQAFAVRSISDHSELGISSAEKALTADPANPINHALLAFLKQNQPEDALQSIQTALSFWPDEAHWHALAADFLSQLGQADAAADHMDQALQLEPDNPGFWLKSGEINLSNHKLDSARLDLEQSLARETGNSNAWLKLADINWQLGDTAEAIRNIHQADQITPDNPVVQIKEAQLLLDQGAFAQAHEKAQKIVSKSPENSNARVILARSLAGQGNYDQALQILEADPNQYRSDRILQLEAIRISKAYQGVDQVLPSLIHLADDNPEDTETLTLLTDYLIQANRLEEAEKTAQIILRILPEAAEVHLMLGRLQKKKGQLDQAIAHLSQAIALDRHLVDAYLELGRTYQDRRDLEKAIEIYREGVKSNPTDARLYLQTGLALKECKDFEGAEKMLKEAKRHAPDDAAILRNLGVLTAMNLINHLREKS